MAEAAREPLYWEWVCPLWRVEEDDDPDATERTFHLEPCGAILHLGGHGSHDVTEPYGGTEAPYVFAWSLECENGHTLLTGSYGTDDDAPYDPAWLVAVGATKVPGR